MLVLELVAGCGAVRIALRPKGSDEACALVQRFERSEELTLALGDDVADVLFEPLLLLVGTGLRLRG